jgi:hypothetical protein
MNDPLGLTVEQLKEKIEKVKEDLKSFQAEGNSVRKVDILIEYKEYLEDELRNLENRLK